MFIFTSILSSIVSEFIVCLLVVVYDAPADPTNGLGEAVEVGPGLCKVARVVAGGGVYVCARFEVRGWIFQSAWGCCAMVMVEDGSVVVVILMRVCGV